jgi:hypothetical protein
VEAVSFTIAMGVVVLRVLEVVGSSNLRGATHFYWARHSIFVNGLEWHWLSTATAVFVDDEFPERLTEPLRALAQKRIREDSFMRTCRAPIVFEFARTRS